MTDDPHKTSDDNPEGRHEADGLEKDIRALKVILRKTGTAHRRPMLVEGALWYLVTLGAVVLSALLVAALVPAAVPAVTGWILIIGAAAATLGAGVALVGFRAGASDVEQIARLLQRHHRGYRNDLVAALEFGEKLLAAGDRADEQLDFSPKMAREHVRRTVRKTTGMLEHGHLAYLLPERELVAPAMTLAACLAILIVPLLIDADWTIEVLKSPVASEHAGQQSETSVRPVVGDLYIYYSHPPYTGLGRKFDSFSTGYIETMVGTEVTIETYPLLQVEQVELVREGAEGKNALVMEEVGKGGRAKLRTSFVALEEGTYHFRATLPDGTVVEDGIDRKIELLPDEKPKVTITSHSQELEVSPDDVLDIEFEVSDDFGLDSVSRVYHFAGDAENASRKAIDLPELANTPQETSGELTFDLKPLALQPKDVVVLYIEATDNNTLTGPGVGQSKALRLRVSSPEDKHLQNIAEQQKILEELLMLLADYLERPMGEREVRSDDTYRQQVQSSAAPKALIERFRALRGIQSDQKRILESMKKLVGRLEEDPLMIERDYTLFSALHEQLAALHRDGQSVFDNLEPAAKDEVLTLSQAQRVANYGARAEATLEKGLMRLEELLASQKMDAIKQTAKDIEELKERLKELLKRYKNEPDPELKKAILREIQRLRQRMAELTRRMQMQLQKLPQEHMNLEAIKQKQLESDTRKMGDSLQQIEKMLEQGDIDGALEALENMETSLDSLTKDMNEQFQQAQPQGLSELDKKVGELMDEVNDLQSAEKALEKDTAEINEELAKKRREKIDQRLDEFTQKMQREVEKQERALEQMKKQPNLPQSQHDSIAQNQRQLDKLRKMLEDKDVAQSLEGPESRSRSSSACAFASICPSVTAMGPSRKRASRRLGVPTKRCKSGPRRWSGTSSR